MKAILTSEDFAELLAAARLAHCPRAVMPILQGVSLVVRDGRCTLRATDLELEIERSAAVRDGSTDGSFVIRLSDLKAMRPIKESLVVIEKVGPCVADLHFLGKGKLNITRTVQGWPDSDYPAAARIAHDRDDRPLPSTTFDAIRQVLPYVSDSIDRHVLQGVHLNPDNGGAVIASDGRRMAIATARVTSVPITIPTRAAAAMAAMKPRGAIVSLQTPGDGGILTLRFGSTILTTKLIEGAFPNYRQVVPETSPHRITFPDPDPVVAWLRSSAEKDKAVTVIPEQDAVTLIHEAGGTIRYPVFRQADPSRVMIKSRFLVEALESGCRTFAIIDERSAVLAFSPDNLKVVIMPMRAEAPKSTGKPAAKPSAETPVPAESAA